MGKAKQDRFLTLYEPVHERFERFCRSRVYGELDHKDIMNDTLLIAYDKFETLRSDVAFVSFLFGICVRVLSNHRQKKNTERFVNARDVQYPIADSDPQTLTDIQFLYKLLKQLPDEQQECILLFEISGFSLKEIAIIQAVSEGAVKQRLRRGREKLGQLMNYVSPENHQG
jgi:RNA polymerase sigma factor (sigma-70 family)